MRKLASSFLAASAAFALLAAPAAIFVSEAGAQEQAGSGPAPKEVFDALKAIDDALNEQMKVAAPPGQPPVAPAVSIARRIKELFKSFPPIYGLEFPDFLNFVSAIDRGLGQAVRALDAEPPDVAGAKKELAAAASETDKLRKAVKNGGAPADATDPLIGLESQITAIRGDLGTTESAVAKSKEAIHAAETRKIAVLNDSKFHARVYGRALGLLYKAADPFYATAFYTFASTRQVEAAVTVKATLVNDLGKALPACGGGKQSPPKRRGKLCTLRPGKWRSSARAVCKAEHAAFQSLIPASPPTESLPFMQGLSQAAEAESGSFEGIEPVAPHAFGAAPSDLVTSTDEIYFAAELGARAIEGGADPSASYTQALAAMAGPRAELGSALSSLGLGSACGDLLAATGSQSGPTPGPTG